MPKSFRAFVLTGITVTLCGWAIAQSAPPAAASLEPHQGVVSQKTLSLGMAMTIANATITECRGKGAKSAAVVLDRAGQIMVALRDEDAPPNTVEMARRKALTARMFNTTSAEAFP